MIFLGHIMTVLGFGLFVVEETVNLCCSALKELQCEDSWVFVKRRLNLLDPLKKQELDFLAS